MSFDEIKNGAGLVTNMIKMKIELYGDVKINV